MREGHAEVKIIELARPPMIVNKRVISSRDIGETRLTVNQRILDASFDNSAISLSLSLSRSRSLIIFLFLLQESPLPLRLFSLERFFGDKNSARERIKPTLA